METTVGQATDAQLCLGDNEPQMDEWRPTVGASCLLDEEWSMSNDERHPCRCGVAKNGWLTVATVKYAYIQHSLWYPAVNGHCNGVDVVADVGATN